MSTADGFALEIVVKTTLLLALAALANRTFPRTDAAQRHRVWLFAIVTAALLPLVARVSPPFAVQLLPPSEHAPHAGDARSGLSDLEVVATLQTTPPGGERASDARATAGGAPSDPAPGVPERNLDTLSGPVRPDVSRAVFAAWGIGLVISIGWLLLGLLTLRAIARRADRVEESSWQELLRAESEAAGVRRRVTLLTSRMAGSPMTWGVRVPCILLPVESREWPEERRRVVLRHELAHIARRDSLSQLIAALACAVYWFHPMMWWAARQLRAERERACDDRVLELGTSGTRYAAHLLELARAARPLRVTDLVIVPLTRRSGLEARVRSLIERPPVVNRKRGRAFVGTCWSGGLAITLLLAAFQPVPRSLEPERRDGRVVSGAGQIVDSAGPASLPATGAGKTSAGDESIAASGDARAQESYQVRDSAGVRIVEYDRPPQRAAAFRLSAEPIFRITRMPDGRPFELPWAPALLSSGEAVVENGEAREIVFVSPSGEVVVRSWSGEPYPYEAIFSITPTLGDTVLVQYARGGVPGEPGRLAVLHEGQVVRESTLDAEVANNKVLGVAQDGQLLLGMPSRLGGGYPEWVPAVLARYDRRTERVDTVGTYDFGGPYFPFRFPQNGAASVSGGSFVIGRSDRPELRWLDPDGTLRQVVRWSRPPLVVTDSMWNVYEARYRAGAGSRQTEDRIRQHLEGVQQRIDEAPLFRRILTDAQGNVWMGSGGFPLDVWTPTAYDVVSGQGVWMGTVEMPPGFQILAVGADRVLGIERDGGSVEAVTAYHLER